MDFAALRVFKAVVDEGGVSAAARRLHRVQSNITTRIQQLEASLGTPLFIRDKRRLVLSPAGELFHGYVEQLLRLSEQAREAVLGGEPRGTLRIGTLESTAASRLPPLLSAYHRRYPSVRVELTTGTNDALVESVLRRRLDGAFVVEAPPTERLDTLPTFDEELALVAPKTHGPIRRPQDVRADTIISFPVGCAYRRRLTHWFEHGGRLPERSLELSSYHAIVACVASGTGVALVPCSVLETVRGADELVVCRLGPRDGRVTTCLAWRRNESSVALNALRAELAAMRKSVHSVHARRLRK
jgi:DNA-binding transcriptional LysR family regulator